jgi:hypothetical protein
VLEYKAAIGAYVPPLGKLTIPESAEYPAITTLPLELISIVIILVDPKVPPNINKFNLKFV